jgi:oxalate decarboxylase/phosphoglucose isomerase-like protein (cupin superfamily)
MARTTSLSLACVLLFAIAAAQPDPQDELRQSFQRGLTDASPFLALFSSATKYRQQFDADTEGYFYQNLYDLRPSETGLGGTLKRWDITNPALFDQGASQAILEFEPCGLNMPHVHPRALEFLHVLTGNLTITFIEENGGRAITQTLGPGSSIYVPQGLLHAEHNLGCTPASFMNTFTHVNPGTSTMPTALFKFPIETIQTAMGNIDRELVEQLIADVPTNLAQGPPECLARCGISQSSRDMEASASAPRQGGEMPRVDIRNILG